MDIINVTLRISINNMENNNKKLQFNEALSFLMETALINSGKVTIDEIKNTFNGIIEDDSMYEYIFNYLKENNIVIQDYFYHEKNAANKAAPCADVSSPNTLITREETEEEKKFLKMYLDEINNKTYLSCEEESKLLNKMLELQGENSDYTFYKKALIENNLNIVFDIANKNLNKGIVLGDLIQEGNLGLIEGTITFYKDFLLANNKSVGELTEFKDYISECIQNAIDDAVAKQSGAAILDKHITDRANYLDSVSVELARDLGRTPTIEEIAKYMSISPKEVETIMKMSLDALTSDSAQDNEDSLS